MTTLTTDSVARFFRDAARAIEMQGWTRHGHDGCEGLSLASALCQVIHPGDHRAECPPDCEEAADRLLGWMLLTGVTHLPGGRSVRAFNVLAAWNDNRRRDREQVVSLLLGAAATLEELPWRLSEFLESLR